MLNLEQPLNQLQVYKPRLTNKMDFDDFWNEQLRLSSLIPINSCIEKQDYPIRQIEVFNIKYDGADKTPVDGLWIKPAQSQHTKMPAIIYYHGYTRNKGFVHEYLKWVIQGYSVLAISIRGQGGLTPDGKGYGTGGVTGWMTQGILDKDSYYYKQVCLDAVRAVDFLVEQPEIDKDKIGIYGLSQGGGISLAVAGLDRRIKFSMPIYPYLCNFERALEAYTEGPYSEIYEYFRFFDPMMKSKEQVFDTLSYFDGINFASRIKCPVLFAIGLVDTVCPPSTIYAAYNHIASDKEIRVYHHHGHEPLPFHDDEMIAFVHSIFNE